MLEKEVPKHHILKLIEALEIKSVSQFEREINVGASTIDKAIKRGSSLGFGTVQKILLKFPDVNKDWLVTGKGSMFTDTETPAVQSTDIDMSDYIDLGTDRTDDRKGKREVIALGKKVPSRLGADDFAKAFPNWEGVPVYNTEVNAGFITKYEDEGNRWEPLYYLRDPHFKDCNFAARITGDSMHSEIRHGDYIVCQEISDLRFIVYGDIYYISANNNLHTCKYIHPIWTDKEAGIEDENRIMLVGKNESVPRTPIRRDMIERLYKVKGIIRGY